jgi:hypothetical protein
MGLLSRLANWRTAGDRGPAEPRSTFEESLVLEVPALADVTAARRRIHQFGCIVVRDFLPVDRVDSFYELTRRSFAAARSFLDLLKVDDGEPIENVADPRLRDFVSNIRIGQMQPGWFEILNEGRSIYDILKDAGQPWEALTDLLGGTWFPGAGTIRRVSPNAAEQFKSWQRPIGMHCDGPTLSKHTFSINVWVPLVDCGVDAPGLQLVPGPFRPLQEAVRHDPERSYIDAELELEQQQFYSSGRDGRPRFIPQMRRGDVLIFHNWIMHASHSTPEMNKPRTSFELRFDAPQRADFEKFAA